MLVSLPPAGALGEDHDRLIELSCHGLAAAAPEYSARRVLARWQGVVLAVLAAGLAFGLLLAPRASCVTAIALVVLAYITALGYRLALFRLGARGGRMVTVSDEEARSVPDEQLPTYTVLVPVFHEPLLGELVDRLEQLDYPRRLLDIRLLLEADDEETAAAAGAIAPRGHVRVVTVPSRDPRTKPKACNYGFLTAESQMCTIYDAEDDPDPLQLRRAVVAMGRLGPSYACVQAQLGFYNSTQNLLTRWFTLDYGSWFGNMLPGLVALGAPVPLGGTSNHFRSQVLRDVGAWDPWNVTEDADLGLRLHRAGYRVGVLDSTTLEEANSDAINWVRQRSRWYKGYVQSFLVHVRNPRLVTSQLGPRGVAGLVVFIAGTPLLSALNGFFWALTAMWFTSQDQAIAALFPPAVYYLGMVCLVLGNLSVLYMGVFTARQMERPDLLPAALLMPLYWGLMWLAAVKAVIQLITAPSYWEKTAHGLHQPAPDAEESS
ncbi:glycosyltransferase [Propionibacterium australiense]|uniref:Glycosyltransferase n=1 Tax=Propionibacterium australiense TaxID=119981 RepID=A0A8B3FHI0_9ACTN|nr:glycosyltransferase [Propionibacterium australiense]RLP07093.1 glycosyltransferase [Propionibacterium australiense]